MGTEGSSMAAKETELPIYEEQSSMPLHDNANCCFCFPCFTHRRSPPLGPSFWERVGSGKHVDKWWARGLRAVKKAREWSEIVAGPNWKTFIRRFNRSRSGTAAAGPHRHGKFNYDPFSYSLNFDEGSADFDEEDDQYAGSRNFSARFASVAAPVRPVAADIISRGKEVPVFG